MAYGSYGYYSQPSKAELAARAHASIARLRKADRPVSPVHLEGAKIGSTWWGRAWCDNITRYADFSNRVERGKRYVRADCVIDLHRERGEIAGLVQGTRRDPYQVTVRIAPLSRAERQALLGGLTQRAESLEALVAGDFPEEMKSALTASGHGLFPGPSQIGFSCSCPDAASLCKHVAAVIMGVAPALDADPLLLFELRGVDTSDLIRRTVAERIELMLANADVRSERVLEADDDALTELFGVL